MESVKRFEQRDEIIGLNLNSIQFTSFPFPVRLWKQTLSHFSDRKRIRERKYLLPTLYVAVMRDRSFLMFRKIERLNDLLLFTHSLLPFALVHNCFPFFLASKHHTRRWRSHLVFFTDKFAEQPGKAKRQSFFEDEQFVALKQQKFLNVTYE